MRSILTVSSSVYGVVGGPVAERVESPVFKVVLPVEEFGLAVREVDLSLAERAVLIPQPSLGCRHVLTEAACFLLEERVAVREFRDVLLEHLLALHGGAVC